MLLLDALTLLPMLLIHMGCHIIIGQKGNVQLSIYTFVKACLFKFPEMDELNGCKEG